MVASFLLKAGRLEDLLSLAHCPLKLPSRSLSELRDCCTAWKGPEGGVVWRLPWQPALLRRLVVRKSL